MSKLQLNTDVPNEIHFTREFNAPRRLVFRAMFEPELIKKWAGGKRSKVVSAVNDARVGGRYRTEYGLPDGSTFAFVGVYQEVSEERTVHSEAMEGQPGEALCICTLTEKNGKTTMHYIMRFPTQEIRDMVLATGMADGAGESYDELDTLLATML